MNWVMTHLEHVFALVVVLALGNFPPALHVDLVRLFDVLGRGCRNPFWSRCPGTAGGSVVSSGGTTSESSKSGGGSTARLSGCTFRPAVGDPPRSFAQPVYTRFICHRQPVKSDMVILGYRVGFMHPHKDFPLLLCTVFSSVTFF